MNMDKLIIDTIKHLFNESNLTKDSFAQCMEMLEKKYKITDEKTVYKFETELATALYDFKTEILDNLLILLAQLTDIEDVKKLYEKLENIQAMLAMEFKEA